MRDSGFAPVTGPLGPFAAGFATALEEAGYAHRSRVGHRLLLAGLSRWLEQRGMGVRQVDEALLEEFLRDHRVSGHAAGRSVRALAPLLGYLRRVGAVPALVPMSPVGPVEVLLADYRVYLRGERGLTVGTIERELSLAGPFLRGRVHDAVGDLASVTPEDVITFMLARAGSDSPATVQRTGTALRSLLRFLHVRGLIDAPLAEAVPVTANWRLAGLPKYLSGEQVAAMVAACEVDSTVGQRDAAVLRVLSRLGLRAGEVAALRLEDFDWRAGEVIVHGKGGRLDRLPLPVEVGQAIVSYLDGARPARTKIREVFLTTRAPYRALSRTAVSLVNRAAGRAGLGLAGPVYAHRLRHTAATSMLRAGASMEQIGQVLRHQRMLTTAVYAKVDQEGLRALARPWPGSVDQ